MLLAVVYQNKSTETVDLLRYSYDFAYEKWLFGLGYQSSPLSPDENRYKDKNGTEIENPIRDRTEAAFLHEKIKVICIVFPGKSLDYAVAVNNTWGKHCTELRFYHHKMKNATLPIRTLPSGSSFELLCSALLEISREKVKFDWIFFATDNTFVIPENFRYYVASLNSSDPHYLGHTMTFWQVHYNWKNAGFAISKGTATALLAKFQDKKACTAGGRFWNNEDWYLGKHLYDLGIKPVDTRDEFGKGRFNGYSFTRLLIPGSVSSFENYWKDSVYVSPDGPACCSNHAIAFNGVLSNSKMYQLEYLFYHLRPFPNGGQFGNSPAPPPAKTPFLSWEEYLKEEELEKLLSSMLTTPASWVE